MCFHGEKPDVETGGPATDVSWCAACQRIQPKQLQHKIVNINKIIMIKIKKSQ